MNRSRYQRAFTLLEVLTATTLLIVILGLTAAVVDSTSKVMRQSNAKIESFQAARAVFESMTQKLGQATLNTYWDYYNSAHQSYRNVTGAALANFVPDSYGRLSDLHFICGPATSLITTLPSNTAALATQAVFFVSPTGLVSNLDNKGLPGLLTACGYFVSFSSDETGRPGFLQKPATWRWRLMELSTPTENLTVFNSPTGTAWLTQPIQQNALRPVAENVIALVVWPRLSPQDDPTGATISPDFRYDSRTTANWTGSPPRQPVQSHQLPPSLQITMVAIDDGSAKRLENGATPPPAITAALAGLFQGDVLKYESDLDQLERRLIDAKIVYRVFTTSVTLKESKWNP